jgi:hypothetical protein
LSTFFQKIVKKLAKSWQNGSKNSETVGGEEEEGGEEGDL